MDEILVLVDLANTSIFRGLRHPNPAIVSARLDEYITFTADRIHDVVDTNASAYRFRLYDGWFDDVGRGTDLYALVRAHIRDAYPTRRKRYRLFVEIADSLLSAKGERLLNTFRDVGGLGPHKISVTDAGPTACFRPGNCAISDLRAWTKGRCPVQGCTVETVGIASHRQQKLVDTSIIADAVWAASHQMPFAIVSDDEDVIPGLIAGRALGTKVIWATRASKPREPYSQIVAKHNIEFVTC
jgi:hypothetical protein